MTTRRIRWGILGTAQIARKNWQAIYHSGNSEVTAVASRELRCARRFVAECQARRRMPGTPLAFGSYEALLEAPEIDAVYIPLPTGLRKEWVLRAAAAGKHVLCEKPCATSVEDLEAMLGACRRYGVLFMDGVMFRHSRRMDRMYTVLADRKTLGRVRRITTAFTSCQPADFFARNIRTDPDLEPHGCLGDLGWYCIRLILWATGWRLPTMINSRIITEHSRGQGSPGVPTDFAAELDFADGPTASFHCSFVTHNQQWAFISGERGYLELDDFVLPLEGRRVRFYACQLNHKLAGCDASMVKATRHFAGHEMARGPSAQDVNLISDFARQAARRQPNPEWMVEALRTQQVMNACYDAARGIRSNLR